MEELMLKIDNVSKMYKLGQIGGTTLYDELQRKRAKLRHEEDPTKKIGAKEYVNGETFMALDGVSFEVKKGERIGIIGHNGAGKSTLLKLISRVTAPTGGTISLNGRVASMLEVGTGFHRELTGRENIYMNGAILGMTKKEIDAKMEDIIEFSECRQFIDTPVKRYSSGMYVKLAFAVAAHLDSEIMIMDEVLAVGDMAFQKKCLDKMSDVSKTQGRTILYVSHNMNTIRQLCNRVIVLNHGKVIFDGDVEKGISLYMKNNIEDQVSIDLSKIKRMAFLIKDDIRMLNAEYINKDSIVFQRNETIKLRLKWKNNKKIDNLGFRFVVYSSDGSHLCAGFCYNFYSVKDLNVTQCDFEINISNLAAGEYESYYVIYRNNEYGGTEDIDQLRGLDFIIDNSLDQGKLSWRTDAWGHFELPSLKVLNIEESDS